MRYLLLALIFLSTPAWAVTANEYSWFKCNDTGEGTTADDVGSSNGDGTLTGGETWGTSVSQTGKINQAWYVDGNDYVATADSNYGWTGGYTFALWIKPDDGQPAAAQHIISAFNSSTSRQVNLVLYTTGAIGFNVDDGSTISFGITNAAVFADGATAWTHVAGVANPTTDQTVIYINGSSVALKAGETGDTSSIVWANLTGVAIDEPFIGARNNTGSPDAYYAGHVDDIRIFEASMTADEISLLYNGGSGSESSLADLESPPAGPTYQAGLRSCALRSATIRG